MELDTDSEGSASKYRGRKQQTPEQIYHERLDEILGDYSTEELVRRRIARMQEHHGSFNPKYFKGAGEILCIYLELHNVSITTAARQSLGASRDALTKWVKRYPEFAAAYARAKEIAEANIEDRLLNGTIHPGAGLGLLKLNYGGMEQYNREVISLKRRELEAHLDQDGKALQNVSIEWSIAPPPSDTEPEEQPPEDGEDNGQ